MASRPARLRVMVDTTILISGSGWPRWPYELLLAGLRGEYRLVVSPYVLAQARRVLSARFPAHIERFEAFMQLATFELVPDPDPKEVRENLGLVRDPSDVPIILAAINGQVDYLVSEDKDLTAQDDTTRLLRQKLAVRLSGTFLREVMGWPGEALEAIRGRTWADLEAQAEGGPTEEQS